MNDECEAQHRSVVLVVDAGHLAVALPAAGDVVEIDVDGLFSWTDPNLDAAAHEDCDAAIPVGRRRAGAVDTERSIELSAPTALRADHRRVLTWDAVQRCHVELGPSHVRLLLSLDGPSDPMGLLGDQQLLVAASELLALGLVRQGDPVPQAGHDGGSSVPAGQDAATNGAPTPVSVRLRPSVAEEPAAESHGGPDEVRREVPASDGRPVRIVPLYWFAQDLQHGAERPNDACLGLGSVLAHARTVDGGRLADRYHIERLSPDSTVRLEQWAQDPTPTIFLFSDYVWNTDQHLAMSATIRRHCPHSVIVHGGPNVPKYSADTEQFFADNPSIDIAVHGEGETTLVELLDTWSGSFGPEATDGLGDVDGLTVRSRRDASLTRTADRARSTDLSEFPSPYLTGEFDALLDSPWQLASIETNRGCPYGCTFCDWGSATLSRVRKFPMERVIAELEWIAENAPTGAILMADANFGIFARDVEIAEHIAELKSTHPKLALMIISGLAKNTTKYTTKIFEVLVGAGMATLATSIALQTRDQDVLDIAHRQNIRLEKYEELADSFIEHGLPLMTDILFGLPGSSVDSFAADLQFCFDSGFAARMFPVYLLPNSPMNDPEYKAEHEIVVDHRGVIVGCTSYTPQDHRRMEDLRLMYRGGQHFGVLRFMLRHLQRDHGIQALDALRALDDAIRAEPERYPLLAFFGRMFDVFTLPPVGWEPFYDEVIEVLEARFGIERDSALDSVVALQVLMMPASGREFPAVASFEHDVAAYFGDPDSDAPLSSYGPGVLRVDDPADICSTRLQRQDFHVRRELVGDNQFWISLDWELSSPLAERYFTNQHAFEPVAN